MRKTAAFLAAGLALAGLRAQAAPTEIATVIHAQKPYGSGSYGFLALTAYRAQLWTDATPWSLAAPFALVLKYGMAFSTDDMVSRSLKEMKHVDPGLSAAALKAYGGQLAKVFPPVKSGDSITALYQPGKPAQFFRDGSATGSIDNDALNRDFFGIWLSPRSSDPSLRRDLLNLN